MTVSPAKSAKLIEMPFEGRLLWIQGTMYSVGVHIGTMWHMWWIDRAVVVVSPVTSITVATCLFTYRFYSHCSCFFLLFCCTSVYQQIFVCNPCSVFFLSLTLVLLCFRPSYDWARGIMFFGCLSVCACVSMSVHHCRWARRMHYVLGLLVHLCMLRQRHSLTGLLSASSFR